jgi:UDP-N-acetylbacillosamine N-acetyltransferase
MSALYIYGASGHGMVLADIARACNYTDIKFVDDGNMDYPNFNDLIFQGDEKFIIGIGNNQVRAKLQERLNTKNFTIISLIHPSAIISPSVSIGIGTVIMPHVVVNAQSNIGNGVILNTGCIIEHECIIGDYAHISPSVALAGNVCIGVKTQIGIGSCIIQGIQVGESSLIGAGSVVVKDIGENRIAYGNPCIERKNNNING